ncbi:efflux transporter outer membrane subunit [Amphiplicatus metriothermophilus]|uniref:Outer membrane protein, multidrug efflux system n=1 Tax=Amphiplicatus metriothermophilus TaxID=1519374 RepID=A0A239PQL2_9PROT|nr:efflux transporter outer membrane subunit [Amphiplicatus metriothermophilus]MBB5518408.1 multidrug efflux system outer membrane protein [Amphiplicatus metriothermophilus]SNT72430.1 outer membrane protein, multidrug efflux system [Amphiplicatus metriothermophilus]
MPSSSISRAAAAFLASVSLSACATMAPEYERPSAPVAGALPYADERTEETGELLAWRDVFFDPTLTALIETALENNRDLRVATLNVERARALYRVQRAETLPEITASADYLRQRFGENASIGVAGAGGAAGANEPFVVEQFSATGAVTAYELDLFGRVRSLNRQALETFFASEENRKAAEIALVAEVANAYLALAADRELLAIARETAESQRESYELTRQLLDNGLGGDIDVQRARTAFERARADAAALEAQVARDENALRLLVGTAALPASDSAQTIDGVDMLCEIPVGVASDVLLGRPDILAAERHLRAANANIGAARAAFFPRILLTASAGTASAELSDLFGGGAGVWSFAPSISVPIFTGGRNRAQLAGAKIDRDIARAEYEGAIQTAFRETADALATRRTIAARLEASENLADAAARAFRLAEARFENGVDDYLSVLDARREDYAARRALVETRLAAAANIVALYRALGGAIPAGAQNSRQASSASGQVSPTR